MFAMPDPVSPVRREISEQLEQLIRALEADLYHPVGEILLEGFLAPGSLTLAEAEALSVQCGGLLWLCPLDPEIERKEIPANIRFVPVQL